MDVLEWLTKNREWVFSGAGVTAIVIAGGLIAKAKSGMRSALPRAKPDSWSARRTIAGRWSGTVRETQTPKAEPTVYTVDWEFQLNGDQVLATSTAKYVRDGKQSEDTYALTGLLVNDRFVRLDYNISRQEELNFGTEILEFKPTGTSFVGRFLGFSSEAETIISGVIEGRKQSGTPRDA